MNMQEFLGNTQSPDLSDLAVYDFTSETASTRAAIDNVLPLARGGDYLTEFDLICAPVMNGNEVEFFVTGKLYSWNESHACILSNGTFYYTPVKAIMDAALLIAPAVVDEEVAKSYEAWLDLVLKTEKEIQLKEQVKAYVEPTRRQIAARARRAKKQIAA
jgi:hypothetical protein